MKIKNKLLPLVGIGAACASITPLAVLTSCNEGGYNFLKKYSPTIEQHEHKSYNWIEATNEYTSKVAGKDGNAEIFKQDFLWSKTMYTDMLLTAGVLESGSGMKKSIINSIDNLNAHFSGLTIDSVPVKIPGTQTTVDFMSVSFKFSYDITYNVSEASVNRIGKLSVDLEGNNIPYLVQNIQSEAQPGILSFWAIRPFEDLLMTPKLWEAWSMKYSLSLSETDIYDIGGLEYSTKQTEGIGFSVNQANIQEKMATDDAIGGIVMRLVRVEHLPNSVPSWNAMQQAEETMSTSYAAIYSAAAYSYYFQSVAPKGEQ